MSGTFKPYVRIVEQPASKAMRFRYECEGRSGGSIFGANSTSVNKTYPSIEIVGYAGDAVVIISCVTKDSPYCPHPHKLIGMDCQRGVCKKAFNTEQMPLAFKNLSVQYVKKKNIESALKEREAMRIDPFRTGFNHRSQTSAIDLYTLRLCFQVFIDDKKGGFTNPLNPVVSEPIYEKKAMSELEICRVCSCTGSVGGGTENILLCEKIVKDDILIRFYEKKNDQIIWEDYGSFEITDVHKQTAIAFTTPPYRIKNITEPVEVFIQLKRPSDGLLSEPVPFRYSPSISDDEQLKRKIDSSSRKFLRMQELQQHNNQLNISDIKQESEDAQSTYQPCTSSMRNRSFQQGGECSKAHFDQYNNPSVGTHLATDYGFSTKQNLQMPYSYNIIN
uniref:RHD domain-containing protein n=1 Tax=Glossina pallidipes TaxID=7398 RepID=A0A1A9ZL80_GLOPL